MAPYGVMQVGRLPLREDSSAELAAVDGFVEMAVSGQESIGRLTLVAVQQRVDDVLALKGQMLPCTFTQKPELNGFYQIADASSTYTKWSPEQVAILPWSLKLRRMGYPGDADLEARLAGPQTRANDHVATGERWHAPNINHVGYAAGSTLPNVVTRTGSDGVMTVYRTLTVGVHPRWGTTAANALLGRVRFVDALGAERVATRADYGPTGWEVHNGLVRVQVNPANGNLIVSHWSGAWQAKEFTLFHSTGPAVAMGVPDYLTVMRNDLECVIVRLTKSLNPGRITVDLTVRRGSRLAEVFVQHQFGTTLKLVRATAEATTSPAAGYLRASAADANGHRFVMGSTRTFVADNVNGGLSRAATPTLDAFVAIERSGAGTGDLAAQLWAQYLGAASEVVRGVRR